MCNQLNWENPDPFCKNPLDFLFITNLHSYFPKITNLVNDIIIELDSHHLRWETRTTKNGFQSGSRIFDSPGPNVEQLKQIINEVIKSYKRQFSDSNCLFIKSWPQSMELHGWFNRLLKNGHQTSHIHPSGWLSGVVYLKTVAPLENNEGAIELSLHGYDLPILDEAYPKKVHQPNVGDIVLFPSSLFHRTIPFTTDDERCVIAFDLVPET